MGDLQTITLGGDTITLNVQRNARAKRLSVRIDGAAAQAVLIVPPRTSLAKGMEFVREHQDWIKARLAALPRAVPFAPGEVVPFQGSPHLLVHQAGTTVAPHVQGQTITSGGQEDHFARRIEDFLKAQAKQQITDRANHHAKVLKRQPARITVKDTKSRWGSCTPKRELNFSWRLILAPPAILNYLVAHECAHMRELNHSDRFWALVAQLDPGYEAHRKWLDVNGAALHAFGRL